MTEMRPQPASSASLLGVPPRPSSEDVVSHLFDRGVTQALAFGGCGLVAAAAPALFALSGRRRALAGGLLGLGFGFGLGRAWERTAMPLSGQVVFFPLLGDKDPAALPHLPKASAADC